MPLKTQEMEEPALNLTPMIDIVMLLVIFFMVGAQFTEDESQYELELPTVSQAQPLTVLPDEIVVNVSRDGAIFVGGAEKSLAELEDLLKSAQERYADQTVVIRGDADGRYQNVMSVLNLCKRIKITNLQLANRVEASGA